jgi:thiol-disulfide isomerase/thioredoxin
MRALVTVLPFVLLNPALALAQDAGKPAAPAKAPATKIKAPAAPAQPALSPEAQKIMDEYKAIKDPVFDRSKAGDEAYIKEYTESRKPIEKQRADVILRLYQAEPTCPVLPGLMPRRWATLGEDAKMAEMEKVASEQKGTPLGAAAAYQHTLAVGAKYDFDREHFGPAFDAFVKADSPDQGARLLCSAASNERLPDATRVALFQKAIALAPESRYTKYAPGQIRRMQGEGKPFDLKFTDAISSRTVEMKDLAGKVVVVDFWATWCRPCVGEMPKMKALYAQYKDKGVEFIGVSLDQPEEKGGLDKLRAFVKDKEIGWPQYYQGNYWDSEFSKSWGVNAIPCVFVVGKDGTLVSTNARGKLETMLPEMLGLPKPEKVAAGEEN